MMSAGISPAARHLVIEPFMGTVTATLSDAVIASSDRALILRESGHDPVFYFPFEDIYFEFLEKTGTTTTCPLKGQASYWRASAVGTAAEDAMWAYLTPKPGAAGIAGHGAFDLSTVRIEAIPAPDRQHRPHIVE
jgi:uncharacterized protein (DUF427 family)